MAADDAASLSPSPPTDEDIFKLVYINGLILLALLVLFLLHVLGSLRRRSSHKLLHAVVLGAYTISYALVSYTLGLMQSSTYFFNEFPVWAVCLLMLLGGTDNLMACKLNDVDDWKSYHVKHFLKGVLVVYIVAAYTNNNSPTEPYDYDVSMDATQYRWPLWAILFVNVFQSCMRINSMKMASKSNLLAKNVKPIVDHMKDEANQPLVSAETERGMPDGKQPELGCRYIVAGEHRLRNIGKLPMEWSTKKKKKMEEMKITTVEDIWRSKGSLLRSESKRGMRLKDICLSMALSKMLNRRFAGFEIIEAELPNAREFVLNGLLIEAGRDKPYQDMPYERMFRVIEVELGFVYDLYYTRYPYLYNKVRHFALCLPIAMVSFCSWLTYVIFKKHKEAGEKDNISLCTTLFLMAVVTLLEAFQLYLHVASNWFKVALIRSYVLFKKPKEESDIISLQGSCCFSIRSMIISLALRFKTLRPWENKLGQYSLLQNYDGTRRTSNCIHYVTLWLVDKANKGCKRGKLVKLSKEVKKAVIDSLKDSEGPLTNGSRSVHLTNGSRSLQKHGEKHEKLLSWVCETSDEMVTRNILVWHIGTTICKHKFDAALPTDGKKTAASSGEEDNRPVLIASSLSQYCAYLIAFAPDLLPGHSFESASVLDKCIEEACNFKELQGAKTMEEKCDRLSKCDTNSEELIVLGAQLAKQLMDIPDRWEVLSDFWAEMILFVSPCDDAKSRAHLEALPRGGEFITHLWALLTHAGVLERHPTGVLERALTGLEGLISM